MCLCVVCAGVNDCVICLLSSIRLFYWSRQGAVLHEITILIQKMELLVDSQTIEPSEMTLTIPLFSYTYILFYTLLVISFLLLLYDVRNNV